MTVVIQTQDADTSAADDPLLSYSVSTTPSPLKASPENPQAPEEIGEVVISVARQSGTPADVEWIRVKVPAGTMAPDLATDLSNVSPRISLTGWTVRLDAPAKEFVCAPTGSHAPIGPDTGFTIQLSDIPMSRKVGTAPITVTERSREGNAAFQDRTTVFNLGKFPADFYLRNFLCEPSIVNNGGDVKLTWERSANATYELLYPGVDRDVTNRTSLDIEGVRSDTTFYLRATTGDPTNPVVRILSSQVVVRQPDLEVGSLLVRGSFHNLKYCTSDAGTDWNPTRDELTASAPPSLVPFNGRLYSVSSSVTGKGLMWTVLDGTTWRPAPVRLNSENGAEYAFTQHEGKLWCVYRLPDNSMRLRYGTPDPAQPGSLTWSEPAPIVGPDLTTTHRPSVTSWKNELCCVFRHPDGRVLRSGRSSAGSWSNAQLVNSLATAETHAPAATVRGNTLCVACRTTPDLVHIFEHDQKDVYTFARVRSVAAPTLATSSDGTYHVGFLGEDGRPKVGTFTNRDPIIADVSPSIATSAPSLAWADGKLHAVTW
ncbi:hypothetical protein [Streptomyces sp. NPDC002952]|uniref:hypothetical protein n=1 Tax=Streptomyces sp. NPDC002952 TaxID=3364673 RepID=UPI0036982081